MAVICSLCGHLATSNRRAELHKKDCHSRGQQACPTAAYERVCLGKQLKHPAYKHSDSKVLDPCMSADALLKLAENAPEASQSSFANR